MKAVMRWTLLEAKRWLREPVAFFFTLIFPSLLLLTLGYLFAEEVEISTEVGVFRLVDVMVPGNFSWVLANMGLMGVYPVLTSMRETGVLKWLRTHPIRPVHLLVSQYLTGLGLAVLSLALMVLVGRTLFDIRFYGNVPLLLLTALVCYTAFFSLGFTLAAVTPTARAASAVGSLLFFPMMALAGVMGPREGLPPLLKWISDMLPLTHAFDLFSMLWISGPGWDILSQPLWSFEEGTRFLGRVWFRGITVSQSLLYLVVWAGFFSALAVKLFRWDSGD